ncbi:Ankyrin-3 [Cladobotryum mycophilum]|uniref:Ankyrin-3 n=1 Tax=Cladobotryum mycophilum TaxID=491253 RepID=A0ABR0T4J3_9HYPO
MGVGACRVGPDGALWIVDTSSPDFGKPAMLPNDPKPIKIDIMKHAVSRVYLLGNVSGSNSLIDDVRFNPASRKAYLTDAGSPIIIILNLESSDVQRVLERRFKYLAPAQRATDAGDDIRNIVVLYRLEYSRIVLAQRLFTVTMKSRKGWEAQRLQDEEMCSNNPELVVSFFECITNKRPGAVYAFVMRGPVTANTPNFEGETPLLAAVRAGDETMVRSLVALGAKVDGTGDCNTGDGGDPVNRTPLQLAAAEGKFDLVKILMELGANDSLITPDGQIALRLAAENGHRDIVDFLPARRDGAWNRWRATHAKEMRRIRSLAEKLGSVLKFLVGSIPKLFTRRIPKKKSPGSTTIVLRIRAGDSLKDCNEQQN